jgi:hypothetical protein
MYNWFYLFEGLKNTEAVNRKKCTIFKTTKCETQIVLFLHSGRNVESLEDGDITQQVNSDTHTDSRASKNDVISYSRVTLGEG